MSNLVQIIVVSAFDTTAIDIDYVEKQDVVEHVTDEVGVDIDDDLKVAIWLDDDDEDSMSLEYPDYSVVLNKVSYTLTYDKE